MRDSVPSASYSSVCNVLRQWNIPLIPTYRVYRLYDIESMIHANSLHLARMLKSSCVCDVMPLGGGAAVVDRARDVSYVPFQRSCATCVWRKRFLRSSDSQNAPEGGRTALVSYCMQHRDGC